MILGNEITIGVNNIGVDCEVCGISGTSSDERLRN